MGSKKRFCNPFKVNDNGNWSLMLNNKDSSETKAKQMLEFTNTIIGKVIDSINEESTYSDIYNWKKTKEQVIPLINHINSNKISVVFYPWAGNQSDNRINVTIDIDNKTHPKAVVWTWNGNYCVDAKYRGNINGMDKDGSPGKEIYEFEFDMFMNLLKNVCYNKNDNNISKKDNISNNDLLSPEEIDSILNAINDEDIDNKIYHHDLKDYDFAKKKVRNVCKPKAYDHLTKQVFDISNNHESGNCKKIAIKNIIKAICSNYFSKPHYYINFNSITWTNDSNTNTNEYSVLVKYHRKTFKINISLEETHEGSQVAYLFWGRYVISKLNPTTQKWNVIKYDLLPMKNTDSPKPKNKIKRQNKLKITKSDLPDIDSLSNDLLDLTEKFEKINNKLIDLSENINSIHRCLV